MLKKEKTDILEGYRSVQDFLLHCHDSDRQVSAPKEITPVPSNLTKEIIPNNSLPRFKKIIVPDVAVGNDDSNYINSNRRMYYEKNIKMIKPPQISEIKLVPVHI